MHQINPKIDKIIERLDVDGDILGDFWPKEIRYIKEKYRTIPFPFKEINTPNFKMKTILEYVSAIQLHANMVCSKKISNRKKIRSIGFS